MVSFFSPLVGFFGLSTEAVATLSVLDFGLEDFTFFGSTAVVVRDRRRFSGLTALEDPVWKFFPVLSPLDGGAKVGFGTAPVAYQPQSSN